MQVAIYSRKSIETDKGESIKNQITLCKEYFNRQNKNCKFEIFEDEGFSGGNINRPSFKRMMELVKIKQFDAVVVYKIDRIARNIVDFVNTYDKLEKMDVKLVSITEGFDPSTPIGKMMMMLLASFAEMERMNIAQRVKDNMKELAKFGRWSGGTPPTGYTTEKVLDNGKQITYLKIRDDCVNVKEMFEKYADGYSLYKITKYFKQKGFNYPITTIQNILNNPTYLLSSKESVAYLKNQGYEVFGEPNSHGFLPYNRRPLKNGMKLWNGENKLVGVSKHKALINLDLWLRVQEKFKEKEMEPHPRVSQFTWLSTLVKCKCGNTMSVSAGRPNKDNIRVYYFRCQGKEGRKSCSYSKFLRVDIAEKAIFDYLEKFTDEKYFNEFMKKTKNVRSVNSEFKNINKKIETNNKSINNLIDKLMVLSNDSSILVTKKIDDLTQMNNLLKEELLYLERERLFEKQDENNQNLLKQQIDRFLDANTTIEERRHYIKNIIKEAVWDSENGLVNIELAMH
ncbi:recombinase family protein [Clostridium akagii]|uniref:recombinase family protein n=1 Tax=Clostridium akagii TaxID=91623 RepID=UPI000AF157A4|nr:recombinase family protein [Clostridium akagii]